MVGGEASEAFAINDAADAVIVGQSSLFDEEVACEGYTGVTAFKYILDDSPSMEMFGTVAAQVPAAAFGLDNGSTPLVAGRRWHECDPLLVRCEDPYKGNAWDPTTPDELAVITDSDLRYHEAQDANDDGNIVGSGDIDIDPDEEEVDCARRAVFWASIIAGALVLDADSSADEARANAVTNIDACDMTRVVGQNSTAETALLWEHDGSSWSVADLYGQLLSTCLWDQLFEATDINESGWIVGYGDVNPSSAITTRAFLLLPMVESCYADLNGDCKVNGFDLAILLADWEETYCASRTCWGDLDCLNGGDPDNTAGDVDGYDLAILLAAWTGENLCSEDCVEGWGTCGGGTSPALIAQLIEQLIGLGEIDAAAQLAELTGGE